MREELLKQSRKSLLQMLEKKIKESIVNKEPNTLHKQDLSNKTFYDLAKQIS